MCLGSIRPPARVYEAHSDENPSLGREMVTRAREDGVHRRDTGIITLVRSVGYKVSLM